MIFPFKNYLLQSIQMIQNHQPMLLSARLKDIVTNLLFHVLLLSKKGQREREQETMERSFEIYL